jgi:ribosomal protein S27E
MEDKCSKCGSKEVYFCTPRERIICLNPRTDCDQPISYEEWLAGER